MNQTLYEKLKEVARNRDLVTYGEIAPLVDLNMDNPDDRNKIASLLGEISTHERDEGRPMLSSVVVLSEKGFPGEGFFRLARELGKHRGTKEFDDLEFFVQETRKVYEYWEAN